MAYTTQAWIDGQGGGTPINAARLNHIENGIGDLAADTGWVALVPDTGFTAGEVLGYRVLGGVVRFRGSITRTAGAYPATPTVVLTLPAGVRPSTFLRFALPGGLSANVQVSGALEVYADPGTPTVARIAGIQFLVT